VDGCVSEPLRAAVEEGVDYIKRNFCGGVFKKMWVEVLKCWSPSLGIQGGDPFHLFYERRERVHWWAKNSEGDTGGEFN